MMKSVLSQLFLESVLYENGKWKPSIVEISFLGSSCFLCAERRNFIFINKFIKFCVV